MLKEIKIVHLGDLYRFYYEADSGEVVHIFFYAMMGTSAKELDADEIPRDVLEQLETKMS